MINPGDIFTIDRYLNCDLSGRVWCRSYYDHNPVRSCRVLKKIELERLIKHLDKAPLTMVTVGSYKAKQGKRAVFAFKEECEQLLVDFFYQHRPGGVLSDLCSRENDARRVWIQRWAGAAASVDEVQCSDPSKPLPALPNYVEWKVASTPRWVMPVFVQRQSSWLGGPQRFCPNEQYEYGFSDPSCTYFSPNFPRTYTVAFQNDTNGQQCMAKVVLHEFINPQAWHFKFWPHVASASPTAAHYTEVLRGGRPECTSWKALLKSPIPKKGVFSKCQEQKTVAPTVMTAPFRPCMRHARPVWKNISH